jgi:CCR4-NOT transcription complex subunit 9
MLTTQPIIPTPLTMSSLGIEENKIHSLVLDLINSKDRENALSELSKIRETQDNLAVLLWHSFGVMSALLQEVVSIYPLLNNPNLSANASTRVCNALALMQCIASHPDTKAHFINGKKSIYRPAMT